MENGPFIDNVPGYKPPLSSGDSLVPYVNNQMVVLIYKPPEMMHEYHEWHNHIPVHVQIH